MKALLILALVVVAIAFGLPMGMGPMADCPMCTSPEVHVALGLCAALVSLVLPYLTRVGSGFRVGRAVDRSFDFACSIFRPPRFV